MEKWRSAQISTVLSVFQFWTMNKEGYGSYTRTITTATAHTYRLILKGSGPLPPQLAVQGAPRKR